MLSLLARSLYRPRLATVLDCCFDVENGVALIAFEADQIEAPEG